MKYITLLKFLINDSTNVLLHFAYTMYIYIFNVLTFKNRHTGAYFFAILGKLWNVANNLNVLTISCLFCNQKQTHSIEPFRCVNRTRITANTITACYRFASTMRSWSESVES